MLTNLILNLIRLFRRKSPTTVRSLLHFLLCVFLLVFFILQAAFSFQLREPTNNLLQSPYYVNAYRLADLNYYNMFFQALSLLLLAFIIIKYSRISRRLSQLFAIIEQPCVLLGVLLFGMVVIFALYGFAAYQLWGIYLPQFRKMKTSLYNMFTVFTLHSN